MALNWNSWCEALRYSESREVRTSSLAGSGVPVQWQNHLEERRERESAYRRFILDLYHAKPMNGHAWIHGPKSGRMVQVGAVDAPVTLADVNGLLGEMLPPIVSWETAMSCN